MKRFLVRLIVPAFLEPMTNCRSPSDRSSFDGKLMAWAYLSNTTLNY
ncbi:MAG: hypothetical protein WDO13_00435 [Verrucomicrobiota bacterium]